MVNVVVNADDFGWTMSCSLAILDAYEKKYINTSTMMSTGAFFDDAVRLVKDSGLKNYLGIHFDLTEGFPLTSEIRKDPFFCDSDGSFHMHIDRCRPLNKKQKDCVYEEVNAQVNRFLKTGLSIHHADSHHHIHTAPFIYPIFKKVMDAYGIKKIRISRNIGVMSFKKAVAKWLFNNILIGKANSYSDLFGSFEDFIETRIEGKSGLVEIMCHPDYDVQGHVVDRSGDAPYDSPFGIMLNDLLEKMNEKRCA